MLKNDRGGFIVYLIPERDCSDPIRALRFFLKRALRDWKLRCVRLAEIPAHDEEE
jgi:hypothetical protein